MKPRWRSMTAALLTVAATSFAVRTAEAQSRSYTPNTYADFPYNQGSLFYRPLGANAYTRRPAPARRRVVPQYRAPQPGYSYPYQAPGYYYYDPSGYYRSY